LCPKRGGVCGNYYHRPDHSLANRVGGTWVFDQLVLIRDANPHYPVIDHTSLTLQQHIFIRDFLCNNHPEEFRRIYVQGSIVSTYPRYQFLVTDSLLDALRNMSRVTT
jgi:hypothetical protein